MYKNTVDKITCSPCWWDQRHCKPWADADVEVKYAIGVFFDNQLTICGGHALHTYTDESAKSIISVFKREL